ncbi:MAG: tRNA lysidine(34) synthetase TilS, partial [Oscillospiraceae bacterium]|nr:tRNA lysidine(34) synthetase TilS [Oscillospiraceae bacterium]
TSLPGGFFAALSTGKERGKLYFFKKERFDLQNRKIFGMIEDKGTANAKLTQNAPNVHKNFLIAMLDSDRIVGEHHIRSSLPGDTLQLHKRPVKLLRKIWSELGVPPHLRANAAVIADEGGVLAAEFAGVAQRAAVSTDTKRVLQIWESGSAGFCSQRTK